MISTNVQTSTPDLNEPATFVPGVPHEFFARLRSAPGLYWQPADEPGYMTPGFWVVTRREEILRVEQDHETFTSTHGNVPHMIFETPAAGQDGAIMNTDPPDHSRLRRTVAKSLAPRVVANFEGWVRGVIVEVLDDALAKGEFDFVAEVAALIPSRTIAKIVGVPDDQRHNIVKWTNEIFSLSSGKMTPEVVGKLTAAVEAIMDYADELRVLKRKNPSDDIISGLGALVETGELTLKEFRQFAQAFINAGFETTHTTIGQSMRYLIERPEFRAKFDEVMETQGAEPLVEEFLRMVSPVMVFLRVATKDTELAGTKIKAGDPVSFWYPSANYDPDMFEDPFAFKPGRPNASQHLSFGAGVHRCIGAPVARLQIRILFEEIHRRGLRLQLSGEPRRGWSSFINQLTYLPVKVVASG